MPTKEDVKRYHRNLLAERDAQTLYDCLAEHEQNPDLAALYRKLSLTEGGHADVWEEKLKQAGVPVPAYRPSWRTRVLCRLTAVFGPGFVVPTIAGIEQGAKTEYDTQPEPEAQEMSAHERSHARVFGYLARNSKGLEGRAVARFEGRHRGAGGNALRAGVLGANDGLVSVFCLMMGVAGAGVGSQTILLSGLAGLLAGAISMALGEWLSVQSARELYQHQISIEAQELEENPAEEMEELSLIYQAKGIAPDTARGMAERVLADKDIALATLAREELSIDVQDLGGSAWEAALTSFLLFALGAIIPVLPYLFFSGWQGIMVSALSSTLGLYIIGAVITLMTGQSAVFSGLRQVAFGLAAAVVTFGVGRLIGVNLGG
ncbi:MAG: VIT1/CCC1 family protein [Syntrophaceae bacterium]